MSKCTIFNMDCEKAMKKISDGEIDFILTSPPYNTTPHVRTLRPERKAKSTLSNKPRNSGFYPWLRYDVATDGMTNDEYAGWQIRIFNEFNRILKKDACVAYNISYGAENTECYIHTLYGILTQTPFTLADRIVWKKSTALPNNVSPNRLTRICEDVFIFCRRGEERTFKCNKRAVSQRENGQNMYENIQNYIEAPNNDGENDLNKATFSSSFAMQMMNLYLPNTKDGKVIYDPFMGTGTTGYAACAIGADCYGSEISTAQCLYAKNRIDDMFNQCEIVKDNTNEKG